MATDPVMVIGAWGMGKMGIVLARMMGGQCVIAMDIDPVKRAAALIVGAEQSIDGGACEGVAQIQQASGGGSEATLDFVGSGQTVDPANHRLGDQGRQRGGAGPV